MNQFASIPDMAIDMQRKYVFFRDQQGKPDRKRSDGNTPRELLARIGKLMVKVDDGIGWSDFSVQKLEAALRLAVTIIGPNNEELYEDECWQIANRALLDLVRNRPGAAVSATDFLQLADKYSAEFFRQPLRSFILVTSIAIEKLPCTKIVLGGCSISAIRRGRGRFRFPEELETPVLNAPHGSHLESTNYLWIRIKSEARTGFGAVEKALRAVNLLRGIWSLFASYRSWTFSAGGMPIRKPIGVIHLGPLHTLHNSDGSSAQEGYYWYQPDYTTDHELYRELNRIDKHRRWALRRMQSFPHRSEVEEVFLRYIEALDSPNPDVAFLLMWSILEKVTNTVGKNYDETIDRVLWSYWKSSRPLNKEILRSIRLFRNMFVHSARNSPNGNQVAYLIKSLLDPLLVSVIANDRKASSFIEFGDFSGLPSEVDEIQKKISALRIAMRIQRKMCDSEENATKTK